MALHEFDFEKEPVVSIVKKILTDAIKMKASDLHFDPSANDLVIKFRINGDLTEYVTAPDNVKTNILTRIKIISGMNITESLMPQTGVISYDLDGKNHTMRVSSLPVIDGEKIVIHVSNYAQNIRSISKIGFNKESVLKIKNLLHHDQGIILVTGTTNSGKTTTAYALLKELNSKSTNIISIEDPIRMKIKGINQVQVAPEKGLTYRSILRSVMLQDPNIIAIDELADNETARSALRASLTGRLVISTMHTKNAYQTIDTLLNMDVENYLLGSNLLGIISKRMVKKLCPSCSEVRKTTDYEANIIKAITGEDIEEIYYPKGCEDCQNGYIDQIPIAEVVVIDDELRKAISNNKSRELIRNIIYETNKTILQNGIQKVIDGETSFQEILRIMDLNADFGEDEKEIKEFILGNNKTEEIEEQPRKKKETKPTIEKVASDNDIKVEEKEFKEEPSINKEKRIPNLEPKKNIVEEEPSTQEETPTVGEPKETEQEEYIQPPVEESNMTAKITSSPILANLANADDDDDDDFNYGDSYINTF